MIRGFKSEICDATLYPPADLPQGRRYIRLPYRDTVLRRAQLPFVNGHASRRPAPAQKKHQIHVDALFVLQANQKIGNTGPVIEL